MKIQKISLLNTPSQNQFNEYSRKSTNSLKNREHLLYNSLNALSLNARTQVVFKSSQLDLEYLKSVKPKTRINKLQKKTDKPIPISYSISNNTLSKTEESALFAWKYGMFSDNNRQRDFDIEGKKRNLQEWLYIKTLDELINKSKPLEEEYIVYRGLFGSMEYQSEFVNSIEEGMVIPHQSYVATATKLTDYTKHFLENEAVAIMRIKLPIGTKGILINKESDEFVLPRGSELKINSIDKKYGIIEAEYILKKEFPTVPDFVEEYYQKTKFRNI